MPLTMIDNYSQGQWIEGKSGDGSIYRDISKVSCIILNTPVGNKIHLLTEISPDRFTALVLGGGDGLENIKSEVKMTLYFLPFY